MVRGLVQGGGFRPFVYVLASELGLAGSVANDDSGALALGLLAALQFMVAWSWVHVPWVRSAVSRSLQTPQSPDLPLLLVGCSREVPERVRPELVELPEPRRCCRADAVLGARRERSRPHATP